MAESAAVFSTTTSARRWSVGIAATLLLSVSPVALHAETSNAELAKEIAELKAQIHAMRGAIAETRTETRKTSAKVRSASTVVVAPAPAGTKLPDGAVPVFVTANKQMQFGALTITPGGFVEAAGIYRTKSMQSDITSSYNNTPFGSSPLGHVGEGRFSARATRVALLVESAISPTTLVAGYGELDFTGAGTSSNNNQTNSYVPRIRHLYTTLDLNDYGVHMLAGQTWSLITTNSKGITPRNEVTVPNIDQGNIVGFEYARNAQIRLVKDFDKKLWFALSAEAPGTVVTNCGTANVSNTGAATANSSSQAAATNAINGNNVTCSAAGLSSNYGAAGASQAITLNQIPDILGKVAYEQKLSDRDIHYEVTGIYRNFLTNTSNSALSAAFPVATSNKSTDGYGIEAAIIAPIVPGKFDFQLSGVYGRGLGKYTSGGLPDAAVQTDGSLKAIQAFDALLGLTYHATPAIDLFAFGGIEQVNRTYSTNAAGTQIGYGLTTANNTGCAFQGGTCTGQTHRLYQGVIGMNDKLYKGAFGEVRVGVNYSFVRRELFAANGGLAAGAAPIKATADDHLILTSIRYYPFQ